MEPKPIKCDPVKPLPMTLSVDPSPAPATIEFQAPGGARLAKLTVPGTALNGKRTTFTLRSTHPDEVRVDITARNDQGQEVTKFNPKLLLELFFRPGCVPDPGKQYVICRIEIVNGAEKYRPLGGTFHQTDPRVELELDSLSGYILAEG